MNQRRAATADPVIPHAMSILFADIKGYSKIGPDANFPLFIKLVLDPLAKVAPNDICINTWGDAIYAAFRDPNACALYAVQIRDHFRQDFKHRGLPVDLGIRIAIHHGMVYQYSDPVRKGVNYSGNSVTVAARIEPIVDVGCIWTTEEFQTHLAGTGSQDMEFDEVGEVELAKGYGRRRLFNLRRRTDPKMTFSTKPKTSQHPSEYEKDLLMNEMKSTRDRLNDLLVEPLPRQLVEHLFLLGSKGFSGK